MSKQLTAGELVDLTVIGYSESGETSDEDVATINGGGMPPGAFIEENYDSGGVIMILADAWWPLMATRVAQYEEDQPGYRERFITLSARLLGHGGDRVLVQSDGPCWFIDDVMQRGRFVPPGVLIVDEPGEERRCHENVGRLIDAGTITFGMRGFALGADGVWCEHSWGVRQTHGYILVETTPIVRSAYFGAPFTLRRTKPGANERAMAKRERKTQRRRDAAS